VFIVSRRRGSVKAFCKDFEQNFEIVKKYPNTQENCDFNLQKGCVLSVEKWRGPVRGKQGCRPTGKRKMQKSTKNRCIDAENVVSYQEVGNLLPQGDFGKEVFLC
jgi:hypothetical protein